jgi:curved DNA-binding protein CbpA
MNPYEVLQVGTKATLKDIKAAYRKLSKDHHPDKEGGESEKFREVKFAFDVLSNPERRARYDTTGRTDESPVTPQRVQIFVDQTMRTVIESQRPDGSSDDPCWDNIRDKIILSIAASRAPLKNARFQLQRHLERTVRMIERFRPKQEFDPVGDALRREKRRLEDEIRINEDAMELSLEAERVLKTYDYDVGPGPEGHCSPGPTSRPLLAGSVNWR